jgi:N-acetylglutamate synthase-like GNAT family acetyltransferase
MTKLEIYCYDQNMPTSVLGAILDLAQECGIGEPFDNTCDLVYTWVLNKKIVAVIAFKKVLFSSGQVIPRLEHVFGHPDIQKTRRGVMFLLSVEQQIMDYGFQQMFSYIEKTRGYMYDYAIKFGFKEYAKDLKGAYLIKDLTKRRF